MFALRRGCRYVTSSRTTACGSISSNYVNFDITSLCLWSDLTLDSILSVFVLWCNLIGCHYISITLLVMDFFTFLLAFYMQNSPLFSCSNLECRNSFLKFCSSRKRRVISNLVFDVSIFADAFYVGTGSNRKNESLIIVGFIAVIPNM